MLCRCLCFLDRSFDVMIHILYIYFFFSWKFVPHYTTPHFTSESPLHSLFHFRNSIHTFTVTCTTYGIFTICFFWRHYSPLLSYTNSLSNYTGLHQSAVDFYILFDPSMRNTIASISISQLPLRRLPRYPSLPAEHAKAFPLRRHRVSERVRGSLCHELGDIV